MIKILFAIITIIHGLIHLMGFTKAFNYAEINQLTQPISKNTGLLWLLAAVLFLGATALFLSKKEIWWIVAAVAVLVSQFLIINNWQDAKVGTIANILILVAILVGYGSSNFEGRYKTDISEGLNRTKILKKPVLTERDIQALPLLVQKYIRYTGALNKPKLLSAKVIFDGEMREKGKNWFTFTSEQHNFFDVPTRLFFMKATMFGMPVLGYHAYKKGVATMEIKLLGLYSIVDIKNNELNRAETVTLFNDMCIFAPAALVDDRIKWSAGDSLSVKATFTNEKMSISAILYFNDIGQLTNFISDDRYAVADMQKYRFSTPVRDYKNINGYNIATYGETIWHYQDGEFVYGKFYLKSVEYNK